MSEAVKKLEAIRAVLDEIEYSQERSAETDEAAVEAIRRIVSGTGAGRQAVKEQAAWIRRSECGGWKAWRLRRNDER